MRFDKEINQALKIALVFTVITSVFTLIGALSTLVPVGGNTDNIGHLIKVNRIWFITVIVIISGLYFYIKKADGKFNLIFIHNPMIRLTSGFLIIFDGIVNLSGRISILLLNIQTFHQAAASLGENADEIIRGALISNVIPLLANLLQILFGLYFVLYNKKNQGMQES